MANALLAGTAEILANALYSANEFGEAVAPHVGPAFYDWCVRNPGAQMQHDVHCELTRLGFNW